MFNSTQKQLLMETGKRKAGEKASGGSGCWRLTQGRGATAMFLFIRFTVATSENRREIIKYAE